MPYPPMPPVPDDMSPEEAYAARKAAARAFALGQLVSDAAAGGGGGGGGGEAEDGSDSSAAGSGSGADVGGVRGVAPPAAGGSGDGGGSDVDDDDGMEESDGEEASAEEDDGDGDSSDDASDDARPAARCVGAARLHDGPTLLAVSRAMRTTADFLQRCAREPGGAEAYEASDLTRYGVLLMMGDAGVYKEGADFVFLHPDCDGRPRSSRAERCGRCQELKTSLMAHIRHVGRRGRAKRPLGTRPNKRTTIRAIGNDPELAVEEIRRLREENKRLRREIVNQYRKLRPEGPSEAAAAAKVGLPPQPQPQPRVAGGGSAAATSTSTSTAASPAIQKWWSVPRGLHDAGEAGGTAERRSGVKHWPPRPEDTAILRLRWAEDDGGAAANASSSSVGVPAASDAAGDKVLI